MTRLRLASIHVAVPLVLGALSYLVLRSWAPVIGAHPAMWASAPPWLRDHFADGVWGWALGGFVSIMWLEEKRSHRALWTLAAALMAAGVELAQSRGGWGAFDRADLVVQTGAVLAASLMIGGTNRWMTAKEVS